MYDFRLYFINDGGHIQQVDEFSADDDIAAIAAANSAGGTGRMERWCGTLYQEHFSTKFRGEGV